MLMHGGPAGTAHGSTRPRNEFLRASPADRTPDFCLFLRKIQKSGVLVPIDRVILKAQSARTGLLIWRATVDAIATEIISREPEILWAVKSI